MHDPFSQVPKTVRCDGTRQQRVERFMIAVHETQDQIELGESSVECIEVASVKRYPKSPRWTTTFALRLAACSIASTAYRVSACQSPPAIAIRLGELRNRPSWAGELCT